MLNNPDRWWMQMLEQNKRDCWNDWNQDRELTARRKERQTDKGMKWGRGWWMQGGWWGRPARARPIVEARKNDRQEKGGKKETEVREESSENDCRERRKRCLAACVFCAWSWWPSGGSDDGHMNQRLSAGEKKRKRNWHKNSLSIVTRQEQKRKSVYREKQRIFNDKRGQISTHHQRDGEVRMCSKGEKRRS